MNSPAIARAPVARNRSALATGLDRRATAVMARARLRAELRSIALDILGLSEPADLPVEMAAYVQRATEVAASTACEGSIAALLDSIDATISDAPPAVVARLELAAVRRDAGIDY